MRLGNLILPDFLVVGAQKGGTGSIHAVLKRHPGICMPRKEGILKEVHFFNRAANYDRGLQFYSSFFSHSLAGQVVGEVTPNYLYDEDAIVRIGRELPRVKLIACLREPVSRAYSQYWMHVLQNGLKVSFEEAISANDEYIERGFYIRQLEHLLKLFPREQLHVGFYEDLVIDPNRFYLDLCRFLGVNFGAIKDSTRTRVFAGAMPRSFLISGIVRAMGRCYQPVRRAFGETRFGELLTLASQNVRVALIKMNRSSGGYPAILLETRRDLESLFRPKNLQLRELLGRLPDAWNY